MENIKKTISLEEYKCRFNYKIPFINNGDISTVTSDNWGKIPYDFYFKNLEECSFSKIKDNLPLVKGLNVSSTADNVENVEYCFRYKQMVYWYNWIINYGKKCKYYKLCKRNSQYVWVELNKPKNEGDFFVNDYNLGINSVISVANTPIIHNTYEIGEVIEVNSDADFFNKNFRIDGDNTRYELLVLNFITNYFNEEAKKDNLAIPFIDIPIHITQNIDNIGVLTSYAKEWEPRKLYIVGDTVRYKQNIYILKKGDIYNMVELQGGLYELFLKLIKNENNTSLYYNFIDLKNIDENAEPEQIVYDITSGRKNIFFDINNDITKIYLPFLCHKAKFDVNSDSFIFDDNLWEPNILNVDSNIIGSSGTVLGDIINNEEANESFIQTKGESKLISLRRYKKSVDEDGNILPFILSTNFSSYGELEYNVGVFNVYIGENDIFRGDVMMDIIFNNNSETTHFKYDINGNTLIYKNMIKKFNADFSNEIKLGNNLILVNDEKNNSFTYKWEIIKTSTSNENIEIVDFLPVADEDNFNKKYQTTAYTDNVLYYTTHMCIKENMILNYSGISNNTVYINHLLLHNNDESNENGGTVTFKYLKDCFLDVNENGYIKKYLENSGLLYSETYNYGISVAALNLILDKKYEENSLLNHKYVLYDYDLKDNEEVYDFIYDGENINVYENIGKIYGIIGPNEYVYKYMRLLSEYTFIDINFEDKIYEVISTDNNNLKKNTLLSNISYGLESIGYDDFQKDYIFKDENIIGLEDVVENIDINIERGISSSFEKHHILCEIKSFSDLENYRNNLFKI